MDTKSAYGCMKCVYYQEVVEDEWGSQYSCVDKYCERNAAVSHLLNFPFNNIPAPCRVKRLAQVNRRLLPMEKRQQRLMKVLCNKICHWAYVPIDIRNSKLNYPSTCFTTQCDAFRYLIGRTDISVEELDELKIVQLLSGRCFNKEFKVKYKRVRG